MKHLLKSGQVTDTQLILFKHYLKRALFDLREERITYPTIDRLFIEVTMPIIYKEIDESAAIDYFSTDFIKLYCEKEKIPYLDKGQIRHDPQLNLWGYSDEE